MTEEEEIEITINIPKWAYDVIEKDHIEMKKQFEADRLAYHDENPDDEESKYPLPTEHEKLADHFVWVIETYAEELVNDFNNDDIVDRIKGVIGTAYGRNELKFRLRKAIL